MYAGFCIKKGIKLSSYGHFWDRFAENFYCEFERLRGSLFGGFYVCMEQQASQTNNRFQEYISSPEVPHTPLPPTSLIEIVAKHDELKISFRARVELQNLY